MTDWIISQPTKKKRGRKRGFKMPQRVGDGTKAMTGTERSRRHREKRRAENPTKALPPCPRLIPGPLTAQVKTDSFVRRYIDECFPNLKDTVRSCNRRLREQGLIEQKQVHSERVVAMLVGTAVDYRIRGYFCRDLLQSGAVANGFRVLQALPEYRKVTRLNSELEKIETAENIWYKRRPEKISGKLIAAFKKFVSAVKPERRRLRSRSENQLCRYCILFAYLDWIGRAPYANSALEIMVCMGTPNIAKMLSYVDPKIVADVIALSKLFGQRQGELITKFRKASFGGNFAGSGDVGGADFDLLVDGCLIDVKATRKSVITTTNLRQLMGYWLLDYDDSLKICSIAIYLARHGHMEVFDINRDVLEGEKLPAVLRARFQKQIRKLKRIQSGKVPATVPDYH